MFVWPFKSVSHKKVSYNFRRHKYSSNRVAWPTFIISLWKCIEKSVKHLNINFGFCVPQKKAIWVWINMRVSELLFGRTNAGNERKQQRMMDWGEKRLERSRSTEVEWEENKGYFHQWRSQQTDAWMEGVCVDLDQPQWCLQPSHSTKHQPFAFLQHHAILTLHIPALERQPCPFFQHTRCWICVRVCECVR